MNVKIISDGVDRTKILVDGKEMKNVTNIQWGHEVGGIAEAVITCFAEADVQVKDPTTITKEFSCWKCNMLEWVWNTFGSTNKDYWRMTNWFVWLHGGADHCP